MTSLPTYCMDTSSLIQAWGYSYRPKSFPTFWTRFERLIADGRCVISDEVRYEVEKDSNDLISWVKAQADFIADFSAEQEQLVKNIINTYPRLMNLRKNSGWADPYVISLGKCGDHTVVTEEKGGHDPPHIPYVCQKLDVPCINLTRMIEIEDWTF